MAQGIDVDATLRRQGMMESERANWDPHWLEVAELMLPRQAEFLGANSAKGAKRTHKIIDSRAMMSLDKHSAIIEGFMMPSSLKYQYLVADNAELMKIHRVKLWFEQKTDLLFSLRYNPRSGFATQMHESMSSLGAFGTQGLWCDIARDRRGLIYRSEFLGQIYVLESFEGMVDTVHRKFRWTARQAWQKWGDAAPECAKKAMTDNKPEEMHDYLHVILPRADVAPGRLDSKGLPIASGYIAIQDKYLIDEGGFRSMPLIVSRYEKSPLENYGRGPGMKVLPEAKAAQEIKRSLIRATQMAAEPPLLMPDDGVMSRIQLKPRGLTAGGLDERGNKLVVPMFEGADLQGGQFLLENCHEVIDEGFLISLFELAEEAKSHVSAAAIMERAGEKGVLLAPVIGRQETELLAPLTDREIDCMGQLGLLDDMPGELREARGEYRIVYDSPFRRALQANEASGFWRTVEGAVQVAPFDASVMQVFDFGEAIRDVAMINGARTKWMRSPEELAEIRAADQQKQQLAELAAMAPAGAKAIKDISQAQALTDAG